MARSRRRAVTELLEREHLDDDVIRGFFAGHEFPIVEGTFVTFVAWTRAEAVYLRHRVLGLDPDLALRRIGTSDAWYATVELPVGSRIEYQFERWVDDHWERFNDPHNPRIARSPVGDSSVGYGKGYRPPAWTRFDERAPSGELLELTVRSEAQRRDNRVTLYLPPRFSASGRYPLLVVHDGGDFLAYASMKTVIDNLIHRHELADLVVAFTHPGERLSEYPNSSAHARWITKELVPQLETQLPLLGRRGGRALMGASFGAVAALSTAVRYPETYGGLLLQSGSFVFTDIGFDHPEDATFDPAVRFMNSYRRHPRRVCDRMFLSCGVFEPLITSNRGMVPVFSATGMDVRYVESRDGHSWESWRDRLREGLCFLFPGDLLYVYD